MTGKPATTMKAIIDSQRPRVCGGTNSVMVEYPTTISAPNPRPCTKRQMISCGMSWAKAAASEARPKIKRLIW